MNRRRANGAPEDTHTRAGEKGRRPSATARRWIVRARGGSWRFAVDPVVLESHLLISDRSGPLAALACSPEHLEELVLGFLFTHQAITGVASVRRVEVEDAPDGDLVALVDFASPEDAAGARSALAETRFVVSGCGQPAGEPAQGTAGSRAALLSPPSIARMARLIQEASPVFLATGGVHASALMGLPEGAGAEPELLVVREDIGRHNTVDKIVGWCLIQDIPRAGQALVVTGRISADLVQKCAAAGFEVVVSRSAPTARAIDLAEAAGITLIGFARHDRFNCYTNWWRISLPQASEP